MSSSTFFIALLSVTSLALGHSAHQHSPLGHHAIARGLKKPTPTYYSQRLSRAIQERYIGNASALEGTCGDESALVASISKHYPAVGAVASLVPGDTVASNLYNTMIKDTSLTALSIPPKGTAGAKEQGTFTGVKYDTSDPE
jgi:hypothetical protein